MHAMMDNAPAPREAQLPPAAAPVVVIANCRAGRVQQMGKTAFAQALRSGFARHDHDAQVVFTDGEGLHKALRAALAGHARLVVLAGGDGTLSHALPVLVQAQCRCAILPLGTLNLLGRDLGLGNSLEQDIDILVSGQPRTISLGQVNERLFHSSAGFGLLSTMARERENARRAIPFSRALAFAAAALRSLFTYRPIEVEVEEGGATRVFRADTVLVSSNRFEGMPWKRRTLDARVLEVHLLEARGVLSRLRLMALMLRGRWREHPHLSSFCAQHFTVRKRRKNSLALSIDGETCRMHGPVTFSVAAQTLLLQA